MVERCRDDRGRQKKQRVLFVLLTGNSEENYELVDASVCCVFFWSTFDHLASLANSNASHRRLWERSASNFLSSYEQTLRRVCLVGFISFCRYSKAYYNGLPTVEDSETRIVKRNFDSDSDGTESLRFFMIKWGSWQDSKASSFGGHPVKFYATDSHQ